ncbi:uncharacterized protein PAC_09953 [Phialocephala subalpina]|uniref:Nucleoside phosphorylase domain-containing protein n=1 Tax=Phialocephala subalpina TaxID=576137 RepID=A0A1L7X4W1_9HELO|nr:uncharacterized protein PAC_09953 [Phialocephala subalpina]
MINIYAQHLLSSLSSVQCDPLTLGSVPDARGTATQSPTLCHPITADPSTHTMGFVLHHYVFPKIHTVIQTHDFSSILVVGAYTRSPPAFITENEKGNKPFNWQRPTATIFHTPESKILQLNVLPGRAYVEHYAALLATYFARKALTGARIPTVHYVPPAPDACAPLLAASNLPYLGRIDVAILGYVDKLPGCMGPEGWETGMDQGAEGDALFAWKKRILRDGRCVAFVGCTACYWGDIGGQLIRALQVHNGAREAIYIGKLGTLDPRHLPNSVLATGSCSMFPDGSVVEWENILESAVQGVRGVVSGVHFTGATSLSETKEWAREWRDKVDWVDPEIGHMAKVSLEEGIRFGFLHVVSDNLSREGLEGLVDERKATIVADRMKLLEVVDSVLERYFNESDKNGN